MCVPVSGQLRCDVTWVWRCWQRPWPEWVQVSPPRSPMGIYSDWETRKSNYMRSKGWHISFSVFYPLFSSFIGLFLEWREASAKKNWKLNVFCQNIDPWPREMRRESALVMLHRWPRDEGGEWVGGVRGGGGDRRAGDYLLLLQRRPASGSRSCAAQQGWYSM